MLSAVRAAPPVTNAYSGAMSFAGQTNASSLTNNISEDTFSLESQLTKIGVDSSSSAGRFMASQWSTSSLDTAKYFEFSLTAQAMPGIPFARFESLDLQFALRRSSAGPRQFQWRSSLDGFAAAITNFTSLNPSINLSGGVLTLPGTASTETFAGNILSLSGPAFVNVSNLTLRLYAYQAIDPLGQAGLDTPLGFSGDVVVPEPSTVALLGVAAGAAAWWRFRRRR